MNTDWVCWVSGLEMLNTEGHFGENCYFIDEPLHSFLSRVRLKCNGTRAETRYRLSTKRRSPFKSAGASVPSTTGSRGVRISGSYAGYTMFRGSVKCTGYPLHSQVSPSLPVPCVTVCHHISTVFYSTHKFLLNSGNIFSKKQRYTRKTLQWVYY
jgi:hypothetical protein